MKNNPLSFEALRDFCAELALLLHAGVGTADGLTLLAQEADPCYRPILTQLSEQADQGLSLADAVCACHCFPSYLCTLLEVGERSGRTEESLNALAEYYDSRSRLDQSLRAALLYPAVLFLIMLGVVGILVVRVLPVFEEVYADLGGRLTGAAAGLLSLGRFIDHWIPWIAALLIVVLVLILFYALSPVARSSVHSMWLKLLGDRGIFRKINCARFAQSLSIGLASGLPLEEALELSSSLFTRSPDAAARFGRCMEQIKEGASLPTAFQDTEMLPKAECVLLELGLRSGSGDRVMDEIAQRLARDSEAAIQIQAGRVEPALVIITSLMVGVILLTVMLPLTQIMSAIG